MDNSGKEIRAQRAQMTEDNANNQKGATMSRHRFLNLTVIGWFVSAMVAAIAGFFSGSISSDFAQRRETEKAIRTQVPHAHVG